MARASSPRGDSVVVIGLGRFGGAVAEEEGGPVEETFEWTDVLQGDWRLVASH